MCKMHAPYAAYRRADSDGPWFCSPRCEEAYRRSPRSASLMIEVLNHRCGTGGCSVTSFSSALSSLVVSIAPSIVSIQARRSRSKWLCLALGLIVTAEEALPDKAEI